MFSAWAMHIEHRNFPSETTSNAILHHGLFNHLHDHVLWWESRSNMLWVCSHRSGNQPETGKMENYKGVTGKGRTDQHEESEMKQIENDSHTRGAVLAIWLIWQAQ